MVIVVTYLFFLQITNITREYSANPLDTDLIYYLVQYQNFSTITPAQETVSLMNLLSTEQLSTILGYPVTVKAESKESVFAMDFLNQYMCV